MQILPMDRIPRPPSRADEAAAFVVAYVGAAVVAGIVFAIALLWAGVAG